MKWILLILIMLCLVGTASATSTYNITTNIITVASGINYPWTVYADVSNETAFNRTDNTSTITANISISSGATLFINDETWKFNCTSDGEYGIDSVGTLNIDNSTITVTDTSYRSSGLYSHATTHRLNITNSELSYLGVDGVTIGINSVYKWDESYYSNISNNVIHHSNYGMRMWWHSNGTLIENNKIYNVTGQGIVNQGDHLQNETSITINNNEIYNVSGSDATGILSWAYDAIISNNTVYNIPQPISAGIVPKECGNVIIHNNTIHHIGARGLYASYLNYEDPIVGNIVTNNTIYNVSYGITAYMKSQDTTLIVSNNTVYDAGTGLDLAHAYNPTFSNNIWRDNNINIRFGGGDPTNAYFINETIINATSYGIRYQTDRNYNKTVFRDCTFDNNLYDIRFETDGSQEITLINTPYASSYFTDSDDLILSYWYKDVYIQTSDYIGINNAVVTFENIININYPSIDINASNQSSYNTGSDGHTDRPNESTTAILLDIAQNSTSIVHMEWNISADAIEYVANNSAISNLNLTNTYYRNIPNIYQNTSTIILDDWEYDSNSTYSIQYRYFTDGTRTIIGREPIESDDVIFIEYKNRVVIT